MAPHALSRVALAFALTGCGAATVSSRPATAVIAQDGFPLTVHRLESGSAVAGEPPRALLIHVDETEPSPVLERNRDLRAFLHLGMDIVFVEPRGVAPDGFVHDDIFHESDTKAQRVADLHAVVAAELRDRQPGLPVLLLGEGYGGDVAARVVRQLPVDGLILLGAGGGWERVHELRFNANFCPDSEAEGPRRRLELKLADIRARSDSGELWMGHAYRYWASYLWDAPMADLLALEIPILMLHGEKDARVTVLSARRARDEFARVGKRNLTYIEYDGVDQLWYDEARGESALPRVQRDVAVWLANNAG